jgi:hypothetical protein
MLSVPFIHFVQNLVPLMNGDTGSLFKNIQFAVGNQSSDFDDDFFFRIQTRHFQIHPNQIVF